MKRLSTRLTVFYGGLFALVLIAIAGLLHPLLSTHALRTVRSEMMATANVFERIQALQSDQMLQTASIASSDFGFRSAVAQSETDPVTARSALRNLGGRLDADLMFFLRRDGGTIGVDQDAEMDAPLDPARLEDEDLTSGVMVLDDKVYRAIAVPVFAPDLIGWLLTGTHLDNEDMAALSLLAAIKLDARLDVANGDQWMTAAMSAPEGGLSSADPLEETLILETLDGTPVHLKLTYPKEIALKPAHELASILTGIGILGMGIMMTFAWFLSRSITRPIGALESAAQSVEKGEYPTVSVKTQDEVGKLGQAFNLMTRALDERTRTITHLALHDRETDLPNREHLENQIRAISPGSSQAFVAALHIRNFSRIRDAVGFQHAGRLHCELAERLRTALPGVEPARLSADMLGIVFVSHTQRTANACLSEVLEQISGAFLVEGHQIDLSLTIGFAGTDPAELTPIERASIALEQASDPDANVNAFNADAYGDPLANLSLMSDLLNALTSGEIFLVYQPKLDLRSGEVNSVEALIRWKHPTRGMVRPDIFITMAEETGRIRQVTEWVLQQAVADQKALSGGGHDLKISINLSGCLIGDDRFTAFAQTCLDGHDGEICFEITETAVISDPDLALQHLHALQSLGVTLSIDDYGSGLSSLAYLKMLPAQELKIDRSLLAGLSESSRDSFLIKSTIDLGHGLGMKVVVEGIEDETVLRLLQGLGCDLAQGYHISRPLERDALVSFLEELSSLSTDAEARQA